MIERTCYKAFGLVLESEFPLIQLPRIPAQVPDVRIVRERDLPKHFQRCVSSPRRFPRTRSPEPTALVTVLLDQLPCKGAPSGPCLG